MFSRQTSLWRYRALEIALVCSLRLKSSLMPSLKPRLKLRQTPRQVPSPVQLQMERQPRQKRRPRRKGQRACHPSANPSLARRLWMLLTRHLLHPPAEHDSSASPARQAEVSAWYMWSGGVLCRHSLQLCMAWMKCSEAAADKAPAVSID